MLIRMLDRIRDFSDLLPEVYRVNDSTLDLYAALVMAIFLVLPPLCMYLLTTDRRELVEAVDEPELLAPEQLVSPSRSYDFMEQLATGDLCDVYKATSDDGTFILKVPRVTHINELLENESNVLQDLIHKSHDDLYAEYLPQSVESFRIDVIRVNAFQWRDGFYSAEEILKRHPQGLDGRHIAWMFKRTLEVLGFTHNNGWIHGAVLPPHLMFHPENHGLQLVDWIHAQRVNSPLHVVPNRFKSCYPPECWKSRYAGPSVDIYLAAKSMVFLAGGDPLKNVIPARIPDEIRQFLARCLGEDSKVRGQDAWQLHEEFTELLAAIYGPPKFHELKMC